MPVAPSGLLTLGCVSQGKPWAKLSWPVGPKTAPKVSGNVQTPAQALRAWEASLRSSLLYAHIAQAGPT
jgi:hypothetical protein